MKTMPKLPASLAADLFTDSPLRATERQAVSMKSVDAVMPSNDAVTDAMEPEPMVDVGAARKPLPQIKMTIYLSKEQVDAIEEEVFRRRRAGSRIGNTDLMREIVDQWRNPDRGEQTLK
jgi:hypothetical protein